MDRSTYLQLLRSDGQLLLDTAGRGLDAPVPPCPGWTVRDCVEHTAEVYEHKIAAIELRGSRPEPWPPRWPAGRDPLAWFGDTHRRLIDVLAGADPAAPSWTWWPADQTAGFWLRRMAQETAVHRTDAEAAFGEPTPVDAELASDGIEEVLTLMLAGDWSDEPQPGSVGTVLVADGVRRWRVTLSPAEVTVEPATSPTEAQVTGTPSDVLLWLWGRRGDEVIDIAGDRAAARRLRDRLAIATQ